MKTRCKKNKELHYILKRESEQIKYIIDNAIEDNANDYQKLFDEKMGKPIDVLERWFFEE